MNILICLFGLSAASIFAIFAHGLLGLDPAYPVKWVDQVFWGIILAACLPLAMEFAWSECARLHDWSSRLLQRLRMRDFPGRKHSLSSKNFCLWPAILVVAFGISVMLTACEDNRAGNFQAEPGRNVHVVSLSQVERRDVPIIYPASGSVVPTERLQVASRINGFIEEVHVDEGDRVKAGAPLVDIDEALVQAKIRAAEAALASAQAEHVDAGEDVQRFLGLAQSQVLAEDELRDARVRLAQATALVEKARAELDAERQDERYTRIKSPVQALVRERLGDPGDLVTAGEPILRLDVLGAIEFEVFVPTTRVDAIAEGQSVQIELHPGNEAVTGRVIRVVYSADPVTRRCKVRITLPDGRRLTPGQFGNAHFQVGQETVTIVPDTTVVTRAGTEGVFVVDKEGYARFRSVRLGRRWGTDRELLAGVEAGSTLVSSPPSALRDGDRVRQDRGDAR